MLLVKLKGQFTPPWPTRPVALHATAEPLSVPDPEPVTAMFPAHVAENVTLALDGVVGITVYFRLPHPVAGVDGVTDVHVPANASSDAPGDGEVGVEVVLSFLFRRSHPVINTAAATMKALNRDFMIVLIVTYHFDLYGHGMDLGLKGKVAMVGGASRGLGYAVAEALAREGAIVSISSSTPASIDEAGKRLSSSGAQVLATPVDVRNPDQITAWGQKTIETFGGVDLLFTNAGGPPAGAAVSFDDAAWQNAIDLLLLSTIRMVRVALPSMKGRGGGSILMSTSASVKEPIPNLGLSTVLRAAVSALAKTLALELAGDGIRVNQIIPGRIDTDRVRQLDEIAGKKQGISAEQAKTKSLTTIPMGRYGEPPEYGRVAAFLLSDAAAYMTGATVQVDGGLIRSVL